MRPQPVQEHLPIWMGYAGPQGAGRAGRLGEACCRGLAGGGEHYGYQSDSYLRYMFEGAEKPTPGPVDTERAPRTTRDDVCEVLSCGRLGVWLSRLMGVEVGRLQRLVNALPGVERKTSANYDSFSVHGRKFGYLWPRTRTVGLKQTISEQLALVSERPEVFEVQFTHAGFGWVVVYLDGIEVDELSELVLEAWRLSAPDQLMVDLPTPTDLVEA